MEVWGHLCDMWSRLGQSLIRQPKPGQPTVVYIMVYTVKFGGLDACTCNAYSHMAVLCCGEIGQNCGQEVKLLILIIGQPWRSSLDGVTHNHKTSW